MTQQNIGIWLDHRKAIIVKLDDWGEADITEIHSDISNKRTSANSNLIDIETTSRDGAWSWYRSMFASIHQKKPCWVGLNRYFEFIGMQLKDADHIWLFGPSIVHHQLLNYLRGDGFLNVHGDMLDASKEVPNLVEIVERVREHYRLAAPFVCAAGDGMRGHEL